MNKLILASLLLVLVLLIPDVSGGDIPTQRLNFDAIKTKYINVDINLIIPVILKSYNGYISESRHHQNTEHYSVLWNRRHIYK